MNQGNPVPPARPGMSAARAPYSPPLLEELGRLDAMTLQQSVPIGPGGFLLDPTGESRHT